MMKIQWNSQAREAFIRLQKAFCEYVPLKLINDIKPFGVKVDACNTAIGGKLVQEDDQHYQRPVEYISRKITASQVNWPTREKEAYAIVAALEKWEGYLGCGKVDILFDDETLGALRTENFKSPQGPTARQAAENEYLSQFELRMNYKPREERVVAHPVSRLDPERVEFTCPAEQGLYDVSIHGIATSTNEVEKLKIEERRRERQCVLAMDQVQ